MTTEKQRELWDVVKPLLRECYETQGDLKGTLQLFSQMIVRSTSNEYRTNFAYAYNELSEEDRKCVWNNIRSLYRLSCGLLFEDYGQSVDEEELLIKLQKAIQ